MQKLQVDHINPKLVVTSTVRKHNSFSHINLKCLFIVLFTFFAWSVWRIIKDLNIMF